MSTRHHRAGANTHLALREPHERYRKDMLVELHVYKCEDLAACAASPAFAARLLQFPCMRLYYQYSPHRARVLAAKVPQHADPLSDAAVQQHF